MSAITSQNQAKACRTIEEQRQSLLTTCDRTMAVFNNGCFSIERKEMVLKVAAVALTLLVLISPIAFAYLPAWAFWGVIMPSATVAMIARGVAHYFLDKKKNQYASWFLLKRMLETSPELVRLPSLPVEVDDKRAVTAPQYSERRKNAREALEITQRLGLIETPATARVLSRYLTSPRFLFEWDKEQRYSGAARAYLSQRMTRFGNTLFAASDDTTWKARAKHMMGSVQEAAQLYLDRLPKRAFATSYGDRYDRLLLGATFDEARRPPFEKVGLSEAAYYTRLFPLSPVQAKERLIHLALLSACPNNRAALAAVMMWRPIAGFTDKDFEALNQVLTPTENGSPREWLWRDEMHYLWDSLSEKSIVEQASLSSREQKIDAIAGHLATKVLSLWADELATTFEALPDEVKATVKASSGTNPLLYHFQRIWAVLSQEDMPASEQKSVEGVGDVLIWEARLASGRTWAGVTPTSEEAAAVWMSYTKQKRVDFVEQLVRDQALCEQYEACFQALQAWKQASENDERKDAYAAAVAKLHANYWQGMQPIPVLGTIAYEEARLTECKSRLPDRQFLESLLGRIDIIENQEIPVARALFKKKIALHQKVVHSLGIAERLPTEAQLASLQRLSETRGHDSVARCFTTMHHSKCLVDALKRWLEKCPVLADLPLSRMLEADDTSKGHREILQQEWDDIGDDLRKRPQPLPDVVRDCLKAGAKTDSETTVAAFVEACKGQGDVANALIRWLEKHPELASLSLTAVLAQDVERCRTRTEAREKGEASKQKMVAQDPLLEDPLPKSVRSYIEKRSQLYPQETVKTLYEVLKQQYDQEAGLYDWLSGEVRLGGAITFSWLSMSELYQKQCALRRQLESVQQQVHAVEQLPPEAPRWVDSSDAELSQPLVIPCHENEIHALTQEMDKLTTLFERRQQLPCAKRFKQHFGFEKKIPRAVYEVLPHAHFAALAGVHKAMNHMRITKKAEIGCQLLLFITLIVTTVVLRVFGGDPSLMFGVYGGYVGIQALAFLVLSAMKSRPPPATRTPIERVLHPWHIPGTVPELEPLVEVVEAKDVMGISPTYHRVLQGDTLHAKKLPTWTAWQALNKTKRQGYFKPSRLDLLNHTPQPSATESSPIGFFLRMV